jgi:hypothetical protein
METVDKVEHTADIEILSQIVENSPLFAEQMFGKTSMQYHVFAPTFDELKGNSKWQDKNGNRSTGVCYATNVMQQSLTML